MHMKVWQMQGGRENSEAPGHKRKMRPLGSEASRKFLGLEIAKANVT